MQQISEYISTREDSLDGMHQVVSAIIGSLRTLPQYSIHEPDALESRPGPHVTIISSQWTGIFNDARESCRVPLLAESPVEDAMDASFEVSAVLSTVAVCSAFYSGK
jgi:hypothetical protein